MAKIVKCLHTEKYMIHSNLHKANWILAPCRTKVFLTGFSCARVLSNKDGQVSAGTKSYYRTDRAAPE